jgi:Clp amino terminal domain, pathogenicity island component/Domain of unknown function (DUF4388)
MRPFDAFTRDARHALVVAQTEAAELGTRIGTEHMALGLLQAGDGLASKILRRLRVDTDALRDLLLRNGREESPVRLGQALPTPGLRRAIELAFHEAAALGDGFLGTEHLLLGILRENGSTARDLDRAGVSPDNVLRKVEESRPIGSWAWLCTRRLLSHASVQSLLQGAADERATGTLTIRQTGNGTTAMYFLFGHLFHAVSDTREGDEAVIAALAPLTGSFDFDARSKLPNAETVRSSISELIAAMER